MLRRNEVIALQRSVDVQTDRRTDRHSNYYRASAISDAGALIKGKTYPNPDCQGTLNYCGLVHVKCYLPMRHSYGSCA